MGISSRDAVVVYDSEGLAAARVWFTFQVGVALRDPVVILICEPGVVGVWPSERCSVEWRVAEMDTGGTALGEGTIHPT